MNPTANDIEWSKAYAKQALSDLDVMDVLRRTKELPECHHLHYLQMAAEKVCKAHLCLQGHEFVRKVHGYISGTLPVIARMLLANEQQHKQRTSWLLPAIREFAKEIEVLAPACHAEGSRPDNSEYPWKDATGLIVLPCEHRFAKLRNDERTMIRVIRLLRQAAERYAE